MIDSMIALSLMQKINLNIPDKLDNENISDDDDDNMLLSDLAPKILQQVISMQRRHSLQQVLTWQLLLL